MRLIVIVVYLEFKETIIHRGGSAKKALRRHSERGGVVVFDDLNYTLCSQRHIEIEYNSQRPIVQ